MMDALEFFHFLRPLWLFSVLPMVVLWWVIRGKAPRAARQVTGIAPHLAAALEVKKEARQRFAVIDGVALAGILLAVAAAGPTWSKIPNPLLAETAPLVVALKVTPSMEEVDLAPSRLDRAKFKILDLIEARAGARTALVAYAGSAHRVAPLTEDPNILRPLLEGLVPPVMPVEGDDAAAAFDLAIDILATADTPGAVLFALDDLDPSDVAALNSASTSPRPEIVFLVTVPDAVTIPQLAGIDGAQVIRISTGENDIAQIERILRSTHQAAMAADERLQWADGAWWLAWPVALLVALWFRRGWTMRWSVFAFAFFAFQMPGQARADGWVDWFLTPDQQGRLAYEDKRFADAGELFQDPVWRGYSKYRAGQYEDAITIFAKLETAEAAFSQGMAEVKSRQYRAAVRSFEAALERQPDFPEAVRNLEVAKAIVEFVEGAREQSDTGETSGIGADDIVFDNETGGGAETEIEAPTEETAPLTSDQWIQAIDTNMSDFLRGRFILENTQKDP